MVFGGFPHVGLGLVEGDHDPGPTDAKPGTFEKVEALRKRLERGETLWNQNDATYESIGK